MKKLLLLLILTSGCLAQETHRWLDKPNVVAFSALSASMTLDAYSTQRALSPRIQARYDNTIIEYNPLARPFVNRGWPGQLLISSSGFAATVGTSALLHKYHHHKAERWVPWVVAGLSAGFGSWNLRL